jgi:hypothetical protein
MSLIFDRFPNERMATLFVAAVRTNFGIDGRVFLTVEDALRNSDHPFSEPVIVHVDQHCQQNIDDDIRSMAPDFGGFYCGPTVERMGGKVG